MGLLWTGKVSPKQDVRDVLGSRLSDSHWRAIERAGVERIGPPVAPRFAKAIGALGMVVIFALVAGGVLWWADRLALWIAGRP